MSDVADEHRSMHEAAYAGEVGVLPETLAEEIGAGTARRFALSRLSSGRAREHINNFDV